MYCTYNDYVSLFGGEVTEAEFNRFGIEAQRAMDIATTGIDNVKKLKIAYPQEEDEIIKYCFCTLVELLRQIASAENASGYILGANGMQGKAVQSIHAGNESVTYTAGETAVTGAAFDAVRKGKLLVNTAKAHLSGIEDANGVNLLYMGKYPEKIDV